MAVLRDKTLQAVTNTVNIFNAVPVVKLEYNGADDIVQARA